MEQLNGDIHCQMFCDVIIEPTRPLTNYKLLDDIMLELAGKLKIQQLQDILAEQWKPYMQNLDSLYTDATCYESEMRYPMDPKMLWKGERPCQKGTCQGKGDSDGGLVRNTERALRPEACQGPDETDGNPVHLLRHSHGKCGAAGVQNRAESTAGGLVKRKHAHRKSLSQGNCSSVIENGQTIRPK